MRAFPSDRFARAVSAVQRSHGAARARRAAVAAATPSVHASSLPARGAFIVLEGGDRAGKTTQLKLLEKALRLRGCSVESGSCPDRINTETGPVIDRFLRGEAELSQEAAHLLFTANRHEQAQGLLAGLGEGRHQVFDRWSYSGVVYSAAKGLPLQWCKDCEAGLPKPDLVVLLSLDPATAAGRGGYGNERYERLELQEKISELFPTVSEPDWLVVDASQSEQEVHQQVLAAALQAIQACKEGAPIRQLWDGDESC